MSTTAAAGSALRPYVPRLLADWRATHGDSRHMQVDGSLAFLDISGFTRLTERLARRGKVGAEQMSDLLSATFAALLEDARAQGADLLKWGGDAVLLLFRGDDHAGRACRAAVDMRATLRTVGRLRADGTSVTLRMSVGVHSDSFDLYLVGDPAHHRELFVVGPPASTTAELEGVAAAGQIVISDRTAALLPRSAHRPLPDGPGHLLRSRPPEPAAAVPGPRRREWGDAPDGTLGQFVPSALRRHLLSEQGEAEHRSVAVAFVRLTGTDALTERAGPTAVADALDECVRATQDATAEHEVTFFETDIDKDGAKIMLVAGAPRSAGHDEERMLRTVRTVMDRTQQLPLRIGVNRGNVFAGDFGPEFRRTYSIKGDAVNLAARVMSKAADGEVLATVATLERSDTLFVTTPMEPFLVKGKTIPVHAARVGPIIGRRGAGHARGELVGRARELAALREALAAAAAGTGALVEVVGDAGIGKSRLVDELLTDVSDVRVLRGRCGEYESSTPYFPFRALMRHALGLGDDAGDADVSDRLGRTVGSVAPELTAWLPLLGIPLDLSLPPTRETSELDEQFRKTRLEEVVDELLTRVLTGPTALVVEDVHLVDDASADLMARLAHRARERPWLLLTTRRDDSPTVEDDPDPDPDRVRAVVRLGPLGRDDAVRMARSASREHPLTNEALGVLAARSGGNPLFLEELVRAAGRSGSVHDLPESVDDLVTSQIDRLDVLDRTVVRYAAVLGASVELTVLRQLLGEQLGELALDDRLPGLRDILTPEGETRLRFRQALVRDVAYEGLPFRRRQLLHEQVGRTIELSTADPSQQSDVLSLHFFHAGRYDRALTYSRVAGERARAKYAHGEAVDFLQRAVESARRTGTTTADELSSLLEALGDAREMAGMSVKAIEAFRQARRQSPSDRVRAAELLFKEARARQRLGQIPHSLRTIRRAMTALEDSDGAQVHVTRSHLATRYSWGRMTQGKYDQALRWATVAAREAEDSADKAALAHAYNGLHLARHYAGRPEQISYGRLALLAYEELGDLAGQGHSANNLGVEAAEQGRLDDALGYLQRAADTFGRIGDEANQANATYNQADVMLQQARFQEALPLLVDAHRIALAVGDEELVALVLRETGRVHLGLGELEQARRHLSDARERFTALGLTQELAVVETAEAECSPDQEAAREAGA